MSTEDELRALIEKALAEHPQYVYDDNANIVVCDGCSAAICFVDTPNHQRQLHKHVAAEIVKALAPIKIGESVVELLGQDLADSRLAGKPVYLLGGLS